MITEQIKKIQIQLKKIKLINLLIEIDEKIVIYYEKINKEKENK